VNDAFVFNEAGFDHFITDTSGQLAGILSGIGETIVVASKEYVGVQWPGGYSDGPAPFRRSGDLQESVHAVGPQVSQDGLTVLVVSDAVHRGYNYPNAYLRLERKFKLVDLTAIGMSEV
jgi:hypothetical protein